MGRKFSDLDNDSRKLIEEELDSKSSSLGMDSWESYSKNEAMKKMKDEIGICYDCKYLNYCKSEFGKVHAVCSNFEAKLSGQNRIVECNCHSPRNMLSLTEMYSMAYIIEPDEVKTEGFISKNPKLLGNPKKNKYL